MEVVDALKRTVIKSVSIWGADPDRSWFMKDRKVINWH